MSMSFLSVTPVTGFEGLADSLVTAIRVCAGAAHLYPASGAFAAVLIVDAVSDITVYSVDLFLIHCGSLLFILYR